tara:strand:+ start:408 stop:725 length:318 start_codon:yes stop_codon:yes gene_type:complete
MNTRPEKTSTRKSRTNESRNKKSPGVTSLKNYLKDSIDNNKPLCINGVPSVQTYLHNLKYFSKDPELKNLANLALFMYDDIVFPRLKKNKINQKNRVYREITKNN